MRLGRPKGSQNKEVKLTGKEEDIKKLLDKKVAVAAIARILDVNRLTVRSFINTRKLGRETKIFVFEGFENRSNVILSNSKNSAEVVVKLALFFSCNQN